MSRTEEAPDGRRPGVERPNGSTRERVVVLCPGRGSYGANDLGSLAALDEPGTGALRELSDAVSSFDSQRSHDGSRWLGVRELDGAWNFRSRFLRGPNIAPVIFACTAQDYLGLDRERVDVVAIGGNSMGWYTALCCAGVLDAGATMRLVATMAEATEDCGGAQVVYPTVGEDWRDDPERTAAVEAALGRRAEPGASPGLSRGDSIRFGGFRVLWSSAEGRAALIGSLPTVTLGSNDYPLRLAGNAAFHSPIMHPAASLGLKELSELPWRSPEVPLIDGRGVQWRPRIADPDELYDYTLSTQVTEPFDFTAVVRTAIREYAPDRLVLLGPGDSLGVAVAQVLIEEGWVGLDSREVFRERQRQNPFVISLARPEQAARVTKEE